MAPIELGVAHTDACDLCFDSELAELWLCAEGNDLCDAPEAIDDKIRWRLSIHASKPFGIVATGSEAWLRRIRQTVRMPAWINYSSDEKTLHRLGVPPIDAGWKPGDQPLPSLDAELFPEGDRPAPHSGRSGERLLEAAGLALAAHLVHDVSDHHDHTELCGNCTRGPARWTVQRNGSAQSWDVCDGCYNEWKEQGIITDERVYDPDFLADPASPAAPDHRRPLQAASVTGGRLDGRNCNPDVTVTQQDDGVFHCQVGHDPWCALLQRRTAQWN